MKDGKVFENCKGRLNLFLSVYSDYPEIEVSERITIMVAVGAAITITTIC